MTMRAITAINLEEEGWEVKLTRISTINEDSDSIAKITKWCCDNVGIVGVDWLRVTEDHWLFATQEAAVMFEMIWG
jgi:hypothetical protein